MDTADGHHKSLFNGFGPVIQLVFGVMIPLTTFMVGGLAWYFGTVAHNIEVRMLEDRDSAKALIRDIADDLDDLEISVNASLRSSISRTDMDAIINRRSDQVDAQIAYAANLQAERLREVERRFERHTSDGHPGTVLARVYRLSERFKEVEKQIGGLCALTHTRLANLEDADPNLTRADNLCMELLEIDNANDLQ